MKVEIRQERIIKMAEHEILLVFNDDWDARLFEEWWQPEGKASFERWIGTQTL